MAVSFDVPDIEAQVRGAATGPAVTARGHAVPTAMPLNTLRTTQVVGDVLTSVEYPNW